MSMMEKEPVLPIYIKHSNFLFFLEGSIRYIQQGYIQLIKSGRKYINNLTNYFYFKQIFILFVLITNKKK